MSWQKIRPLILAVIAAFLVICVSEIAIANSEDQCHQKLLFRFGV